MRINFLVEELMETATACQVDGILLEQPTPFDFPKLRLISNTGHGPLTKWHMEKTLDGLVDLVYVALGTAWMMGLDFPEAWRRVHEANMQKVRAKKAEESKRGTSVDLVKPPGWTPPDLSDLVVCPACGGDGGSWLAGASAHPSNWTPCSICGGVEK